MLASVDSVLQAVRSTGQNLMLTDSKQIGTTWPFYSTCEVRTKEEECLITLNICTQSNDTPILPFIFPDLI